MKKSLAILGVILLTIPLLWLLSAVGDALEMSRNPESITKEKIIDLVYSYKGSGFMGMMAIMWLGFVVDGFGYRERWLWKTMLTFGFVWLFHIPTGTMVGLALFIYTIGNRKKFKNKSGEPGGGHNSGGSASSIVTP
ncbi:hypothetical protein [Pelagicoccus mobilis]|uniref:Uncharacterized protein n=1 Tax=Pelagicoccus mobilis TaxID=415221 RepID=A0A934VUP6_9BACT|nr:hypothetical protein [Pelagicoccus mobilis]MBK1880729.1 hypothetical protein [Pelagicoccus mobilis]